jgi:GNAT superfamily N-acetyltransferase
MDIRVVSTDADYEAWRRVRIEVVPFERADTVEELRRDATPDRLLILAERDGVVVGSGSAGRSQAEGIGSVAVRVLPAHRRQGIGTILLTVLTDHLASRGFAEVRAAVDEPAFLGFTDRYGFTERDRQVEQLRPIGDEPHPGDLGIPGIEIVTLADRPHLWADCYDRFGREVLADFAVTNPLHISPEEWATSWPGDPMFLALAGGEVIGCAGLTRDTDRPERAENMLTAVRRDWRGRGIAVHLKRLTLHWAASNGVSEVYTWTQRDNDGMRSLNERLGYAYGHESVTVVRPL